MTNTYCIIKVEDISKVDFNLLVTKDAESLVKSNDETKCIIEWAGEQPAFINTIEVVGVYTHEKILNILGSGF